jgi:hypothetical protein
VQFCINDLNDPTLHFDANTRLVLGALPAAAYPEPPSRPPSGGSLPRAWCRGLFLCDRLGRALAPEPSAEELRAAFEPRVGPEHAAAWDWLEARYLEIARAAAARSARFAVLVFPYAAQTEAGAGDRRLQERMGALAGRNGWTSVDLLPAFRRAGATGRNPLFLDLWHPTARGHAVAADAALRALACRGLLPEVPGVDCRAPP